MISEKDMKIVLALRTIQYCETSPQVIISFSKDMCYERPFQFPPFKGPCVIFMTGFEPCLTHYQLSNNRSQKHILTSKWFSTMTAADSLIFMVSLQQTGFWLLASVWHSVRLVFFTDFLSCPFFFFTDSMVNLDLKLIQINGRYF